MSTLKVLHALRKQDFRTANRAFAQVMQEKLADRLVEERTSILTEVADEDQDPDVQKTQKEREAKRGDSKKEIPAGSRYFDRMDEAQSENPKQDKWWKNNSVRKPRKNSSWWKEAKSWHQAGPNETFEDDVCECPRCHTKYPAAALIELSSIGGGADDSPCCGVPIEDLHRKGTFQWDADQNIATLVEALDPLPQSEIDRVFREIDDPEEAKLLCGIREEDEKRFKTVKAPESLMRRQNRVNDYLHSIGLEYHNAIPLDDIFSVLRANGFEPVQEDGTAWSGLLLGKDGTARIELKNAGGPTRWLVLTWHKMQVSGRFELVGYIS